MAGGGGQHPPWGQRRAGRGGLGCSPPTSHLTPKPIPKGEGRPEGASAWCLGELRGWLSTDAPASGGLRWWQSPAEELPASIPRAARAQGRHLPGQRRSPPWAPMRSSAEVGNEEFCSISLLPKGNLAPGSACPFCHQLPVTSPSVARLSIPRTAAWDPLPLRLVLQRLHPSLFPANAELRG